MDLSDAEYQVCDKLARGYQVKEVADMLCRSPYTIDTHIKNVKRKNKLNNIADIVREFIRSLEKRDEWFKTLVVIGFVLIQSSIVFGVDIEDFIAISSRTRMVRTIRTGRKTRE